MAATDTPAKRRTRGQNEGSIYLRASDGKWVASLSLGWHDGKRARKYFYGETRADVATKLTAALAKQQRGQKIVYERQTVKQFLDHWHAETVVPNRAPNTATAYRFAIDRHIDPVMGVTQLAKLTPRDVQAMLTRDRQQGYSPKTSGDALAVLRLALKQAERLDLVQRNVATLVDRPRVEPFACNPFTPEEARLFLASVANDRLSALYEVATRIGLRRGELCGLQWRDVDLDDGVLRVNRQLQRINRQWALVPPKSKRSRRTIELTAPLVAALTRRQERQDDERDLAGGRWQPRAGWDLVFCNTLGGPLDTSHLGTRFHEHVAAAGLERRRLHDLRHTAVTLMIAAGVPERIIMEIMGHHHLDMTRIYGHVLPPSRRDALGRVDALLDGREGE